MKEMNGQLSLFEENEIEEIKKDKTTKTNKIAKVTKTTVANKTNKIDKSKTNKKDEKFKYPFALYTNGGVVDISNFGFEDGKEYTGEEISKIMLQHRYYEFSAEQKNFKYFKEDNVIYYSGSDFKKG